MHHTCRLLFYLLSTIPVVWHTGAAQPIPDTAGHSPVVVFPRACMFPHKYADGLSHQFGVSKDLSSAMIRGSIGGHIPVLEVNLDLTTLQFGAGATVLTSIIKKPGLLQVVTVDFLVEFPVDIRLTDRTTLRTGYGHFSAHFADDGIEILGRSSINYAKDYLMLFGSWQIPAVDGALYAGGHWDYHSLPEEESHWTAQWGIEAGNLRLLPEVCLYAALDIQWKSEVAWATLQSYQCGLKLFPRGERAVRIAYTYRTGLDERGQFYRQQTDIHLIGIYIDF